jgi:hypothetical protein
MATKIIAFEIPVRVEGMRLIATLAAGSQYECEPQQSPNHLDNAYRCLRHSFACVEWKPADEPGDPDQLGWAIDVACRGAVLLPVRLKKWAQEVVSLGVSGLRITSRHLQSDAPELADFRRWSGLEVEVVAP